jgi:predicted ATPase/DNA-binding XRE family transcriptional regulator
MTSPSSRGLVKVPMEDATSFGRWLQRQRKALDLTQAALAGQIGYARETVRKVEAGKLRPSKELAARLAVSLGIASSERDDFVRFARGGQLDSATSLRSESSTDVPPPNRHNLPVSRTTFIGREREIREITDRLAMTRLLTLAGAGGCGKTRLALQVAAAVVEEYEDGVWLIELATLADPALVPQTVATVLGVREEPGQPILGTLVSTLRGKQLLLVLDNCEHLVGACAALADQLVRACPRLRILATSREVLHLDGEASHLVLPLALPDPSDSPDPQRLFRFEAVRLFLDRAASVQPGFVLTSENAAPVAQVCRQVDGIPLAIELATAYVRGISVEQLAARLDRRFALLSRGSRSALPRHQTLRALVDWSYNLLDEPERLLFARLAVFVGGFTLAAAEAVCADGELVAGDIVQSLLRLVDASLVVVDASEERYRLLETLREYAGERLATSDLSDSIRGRHADYYLALAAEAIPQYAGPEHDVLQRQFQVERDNLRAALAWFQRNDPTRGLRLASALERFWYFEGNVREGKAYLESLLTRVTDRTALRAKALRDLAKFHELQRELDLARSRAEESLAVSREIGDRQATISTLVLLGFLATGSGDPAQARSLFEEGLSIAHEEGSAEAVIGVLRGLGTLAIIERDYERAHVLVEESLARSRRVGYRFGVVAALQRLGPLTRLEGDYPRARVFLEEGLAGARAINHQASLRCYLASLANLARCQGDSAGARQLLQEALRGTRLPVVIATCLGSFGVLAVYSGATARGVRLLAAAKRQDSTLNGMHVPELPIDAQASLRQARAALGEHLFQQAWFEGDSMTLEQAIGYALEEDEF